MAERKYSVTEIDRMRRTLVEQASRERPRTNVEHSAVAEDRLRTFMLNGTSPDELERAALQRVAEDQHALDKQQAFIASVRQHS